MLGDWLAAEAATRHPDTPGYGVGLVHVTVEVAVLEEGDLAAAGLAIGVQVGRVNVKRKMRDRLGIRLTFRL